MKYNKRIAGFILSVVMGATALVGCGTSIDDTAVALTVGEEDVTLGVINFYARYQAAVTETYYSSFMGDDMWALDMGDGTTYQDSVKDGIVTTFEELVVIRQHAEALGVSLTEEELAAIDAVAEEFYNENEEEIRDKVSGTKENIAEVLELFAYDVKCKPVMVQDVDTEVSDEEAAQKKMTYVFFSFTTTDDEGESVTMTDEEKETLKASIEAMIEAAAESDLYTVTEAEGYSPYERTFDIETTSPNTDLIAEVDALAVGECTSIIETDSGYYVAQLTSEFDEEATETEKETIITERETELYNATIQEWLAEIEVVVNESEIAKIDFEALTVWMATEETVTEETVTEETVTEETVTEETVTEETVTEEAE
ncbi:MAG: peptidyl-prolyl cis-trans isomerase [Eubacteriales bacterium]